MALKYSITHNGNTWNSSANVSSISLSNGSTTSSITSAGTRTLNCAGKVAANNLVIGAKTLNCTGKIMAGNVVITAQNVGRFVCVGDNGSTFSPIGCSYYSLDGITWVAMSALGSYKYLGVTSSNNRFVCVGTKSQTRYSSDGTSWTTMTAASTNKILNAVAYGNGKFVAVGASGVSWYSTNGTS